jgi:hypothetical protein
MDNLVYLSLPWLSWYDPDLLSDNYAHNRWFKLSQAEHWPLHTTSRVSRLNTPWPLANTVCPIPDLYPISNQFDQVIESIAHEFCEFVLTSGRQPYVCWSGGVDSTSILVSLLKVAPPQVLNQIIVLHNDRSVTENAYFYEKFIRSRFSTQDIDTFAVTPENYDNIVIVDGEGGNQIMGATAIQKLIYSGQFDLLNQPWQKQKNLKCLLMGATDFNIELVTDSIACSPVPIETGCDFLWWFNFNFKFDEVLLRKLLSYTNLLSPCQTDSFWKNGLYRFYSHPHMQVWSMLNQHLRRESSQIMPKHIPKKYIFDFDRNDLWYTSKVEEGSTSDVFFSQDVGSRRAQPIFAIDQHWNKYSIADADTRSKLGQILQRI